MKKTNAKRKINIMSGNECKGKTYYKNKKQKKIIQVKFFNQNKKRK